MNLSSDDPDHSHENEQPHKVTFKENKKLFIKNQLKAILKFIWNNKQKEFFGRDGESWTKLSLFYFVFYLILGFYTWAMMAIFMGITRTDMTKPKYPGKEGALDKSTYSPGMGVRPHIGSTAAVIKLGSEYITNLKLFLEPYKESSIKAIDCNSSTTTAPSHTGCRYDIFSYLEKLNCTEKNNYGYNSNGNPCVLIKLNNVFGWKPTGFKKIDSAWLYNGCQNPAENLSMIYISCQGDSSAAGITYMSPFSNETSMCYGGIPYYFYPYENQDGYMQPVIPIQLNVIKRGSDITLECRAWADNLKIEEKLGYGSIKFKININ